MQRVLILVEGQTEEAIVREVLRPHLLARGIWATAKILTTKRTKSGPDFKGGVGSYRRVRSDLDRLLGDRGAARVTTMLDFYGLPADFPGRSDLPAGTGQVRVEHVEAAWRAEVDHPRFDPHLVLHESEALVFCDPMACDLVFPDEGDRRALTAVRRSFPSPEDIDEGPDTAPSKRILRVVPDYQKVSMGPLAIEQIGLPRVRAECPHFDGWLRRIEALTTTDSLG